MPNDDGTMLGNVQSPQGEGAMGDGSMEGECLRTYFLQVAVLSNHQNGRDTHIRQVKIYGPRTSPEAMIGQGMQFTTAEYGQFATVR